MKKIIRVLLGSICLGLSVEAMDSDDEMRVPGLVKDTSGKLHLQSVPKGSKQLPWSLLVSMKGDAQNASDVDSTSDEERMSPHQREKKRTKKHKKPQTAKNQKQDDSNNNANA